MSTPDAATRVLDTVRERLDVVTRETRFSPVQDVLGHPSGLPTPKELDHVAPSRSRTTIRLHLQQLVDAGIVEKVELPGDRRQNGLPYTFYGISEEGRRSLEEHEPLRADRLAGRATTGSRRRPRSNATSQLRVPNGEWFDGANGRYSC